MCIHMTPTSQAMSMFLMLCGREDRSHTWQSALCGTWCLWLLINITVVMIWNVKNYSGTRDKERTKNLWSILNQTGIFSYLQTVI